MHGDNLGSRPKIMMMMVVVMVVVVAVVVEVSYNQSRVNRLYSPWGEVPIWSFAQAADHHTCVHKNNQ